MVNKTFERKIRNMTEEELEAHIEKLTANISTANLPEALAIGQQMELINKIIWND